MSAYSESPPPSNSSRLRLAGRDVDVAGMSSCKNELGALVAAPSHTPAPVRAPEGEVGIGVF